MALGLVSGALVLALLLIERSIGEQLEKEISASLQLSSLLARLFSWTEHSLSEVTEEPRLAGRTPQSSSRCPFLVSCFWLLWLLRSSRSRLLQVWGGLVERESNPRFSLVGVWGWVWVLGVRVRGRGGGVGCGELWTGSREEGLRWLELEFSASRGSVVVVVPFWVVKELSTSRVVVVALVGGASPVLSGLLSWVCCVAMAASLSLAECPESWALRACSREYCCRWASLDSRRAS